MSASTTFHCDGCGKDVDTGTANEFSGIWQGQSTVASGSHQWHSCSGKCAAAYVRTIADAIEARGEELAREREKAAQGAAHRQAVQAAAEYALAAKRAREA